MFELLIQIDIVLMDVIRLVWVTSRFPFVVSLLGSRLGSWHLCTSYCFYASTYDHALASSYISSFIILEHSWLLRRLVWSSLGNLIGRVTPGSNFVRDEHGIKAQGFEVSKGVQHATSSKVLFMGGKHTTSTNRRLYGILGNVFTF